MLIRATMFVLLAGMFAGAVGLGRERGATVPYAYLREDFKLRDELRKLERRLRTDALKKEAKRLAPLVMSRDSATVRAAIDFFHDLQARGMLAAATANKGYETKAYAVDALRQIARPGDVRLATFAANKLETTTTLAGGGSETTILRARYRYSLVRLAEALTGLTLRKQAETVEVPVERVPDILKPLRKWLAAKKAEEAERAKPRGKRD